MTLTTDEDLIARVRAVAGRDIHDTESNIGLYRRNAVIINGFEADPVKKEKALNSSSYAYPDKNRYDAHHLIYEKCERILRSFLITNDIRVSEKIVEEAIKKEMEDDKSRKGSSI